MSLFTEFKALTVRGNLLDIASGVMIGIAVIKIVTSLVSEIVMPFIHSWIEGIGLSNVSYVIQEAVGDMPAMTVHYETLIQVVIDSLMIAVVVFILIKAMNRAMLKNNQ